MSETDKAGGNAGCYCMGAGPQISSMMQHFLSETALEHFRNSKLEFLKAMRALIDQRIEHLSKPPKKGTSVSVE